MSWVFYIQVRNIRHSGVYTIVNGNNKTNLFINNYCKFLERMKLLNIGFIFFLILIANSCHNPQQKKIDIEMKDLMIRIAEIEIDPTSLEEYKTILKEESKASVKLEPGVISIYPMFQKDNPTQVRILEIYANRAAYKSHLETPHFMKYKATTFKMVKSLRLIDLEAIDTETMFEIFCKLKK